MAGAACFRLVLTCPAVRLCDPLALRSLHHYSLQAASQWASSIFRRFLANSSLLLRYGPPARELISAASVAENFRLHEGENPMTKKRFALGSITGLFVSLLLVALITPFDAKAGGASAPSLEGSWNVVVGPGSPTEFRTLVTYAAGGGLMATAPVVPPPFHASTAHGTWERTGGHQFTFTFLALLYNPTGHFVGTLKVRETLTLDNGGDQYDGTSSIEVFDPLGNVIPAFSSCGGTAHGTRIDVEPPPCL
jgi:hypothetical protein